MASPYDDAALARALQEEYEKEYRKRSMQQHLRRGNNSSTASRDSVAIEAEWSPHFPPAPTAPVAGPTYSAPVYPFTPFVDHDENYFTATDSGNMDGSDNIEVTVGDAAFARQMEQLMVEEEMQRQSEAYIRRKERSFHRSESLQRGTSARSVTPTDRVPRSREPVGDPRSRAKRRARSTSRNRTNPPSARARMNSSDHTPDRKIAAVSRQSPRTTLNTSQRSVMLERSSSGRFHSAPATLADIVHAKPPSLSDAEIARRLEQEERDEALARKFVAQEQMRRSNTVLANSESEQSPWTTQGDVLCLSPDPKLLHIASPHCRGRCAFPVLFQRFEGR
jgi:hypothetical protein